MRLAPEEVAVGRSVKERAPPGMQLDVNVDCGCEGLLSLSTTCESDPEVVERRAHCGGKIAQKKSALLCISSTSFPETPVSSKMFSR